MASLRKVKCPFCSYSDTKEKVINHIELKHEDMIPQGFTAARVLFNFINKKDHGTCVICKKNTSWNEKTNKYNRLCDKPECRNKLREIYKKNMLKVYGKTTLLNDPNQQKKMLANRSISGVYKFTNGKIKEYTGSFEKKFLQFMDTMMGYDPDDIIMPGPTLEYEYNGEKHQWITDALIVPYNLIIEVKDGGDFKNNRSMVSYREKQVAKEEMITNMGKYNYLRLTNNQFGQLIDILYELKMQMIDDSEENKKTIIKIHEGFFDDLKKNIKITHQNLNPKDEKTKIAFISEKNYKDKSYNKNIPVFNKSELKKRLLYAGIKRQIPRSDYNDMRKLVVMPESIWNEYKNENILIFEINKENCKKIETTANALNSTVAKLSGFDVYYTVTKDKLKNLIKKETVRNIIKNTGYRLTTLWNGPNHPGRDLNINESLDELNMTNGQKVYKRYLEIHKKRLKDSFNSRIIPLRNALLLSSEECYELRDRILKHDKSRMSDEEFDPLRKAKFPEDEQEKKEGKKEKDAAWKHHYALNDHHPEHWKGKEIPNIVIAEMIIDWETDCRHDGGNPLNWYLNTKEGIETQKKINPKTRLIIERVLKTIYDINMNLKDNYDRYDDPVAVKESIDTDKIIEKVKEYEEYIKEHIQNVRNSYNDRKSKIQLVLRLSEGDMQKLENRIKNHDASKWSNEEFDAYRRHFHSVSDKEKEDSKEDFEQAWKHHYSVNDHHPEYWKNTNMSNIAIAELICDWEAMGRKFGGNPLEYFEKNKSKLKTKMNEYTYDTIYKALKNIYDIKMDLKESVKNESILNPKMLDFTFDKDIYINYDKPYKVYKCYPYAFYDFNLPRLKVDPMVMNQNKKLAIYGCIYLMTKGATGSNTFKPLEIKKSWWEKHKRDRVYWIESKGYHEYKGQLIVDGTNKNNYKAIVTTLDKLIHTEGSKVITINFY